MRINEDIFDTLHKVAIDNEGFAGAKLAAAIVKNGRIVSIGTNRNKTDPLQAKYAKNKEAIYLHAEIHAIKNALRELDVDELKETELYISRVRRPSPHSNEFVCGIAEPCAGCARAIAEFNIRSVAYTTNTFGCFGVT